MDCAYMTPSSAASRLRVKPNFATCPMVHKPESTMSRKPASGIDGSESQESDDDDDEDDDELRTPLFAHESFGVYDFAQQDAKHECCDVAVKVPFVKQPLCHADIDPNDPTLEKFPTETLSVLSTLRRIQSCHDDNRPYLHGQTPSRDTVDHDSQSTVSASTKRTDKRLSHSPLSHPRTCSALGAIAEEPKASGDDNGGEEQAALEQNTRPSPETIRSSDIAGACYQDASSSKMRGQE
ncbi:hypothetical protein CDD81_7930 [Ophiocordyceps australis]|uniref:Uncharacterized protein n=1 Tax=Ophiocordyceps australis TaxID=1399860 RepID=A0A2C5XZG3_9HYPO|nr:hypothetical protein CDD81_7930 [Ophiocordyceps australis]